MIQGQTEDIYQPQDVDGNSDYCQSEESYHSYIGSDNEDEITNHYVETYLDNSKITTIELNSKFSNKVIFKRALNQYALKNEVEYFVKNSEPTRFTARCVQLTYRWGIHAAILQDGVTYKVKKLSDSHTCIQSNKGGNKCATQGWTASVIKDKMKSDGDVSVTKLKKWLIKHYNVEDHITMIDAFKEEIRNKNLESCRPYISLDGCHLKWKFTGVLVSTTGIDENNSIFQWPTNLGEYEICRSNENRAAVKGLPCIHVADFIAFLRDYNWEKYVDEYFTIEKLKEAYAMEIALMLAMDEWVHTEMQKKIYPPLMKRPAR
nr:hypothetical protein [Tanacetum cinerariifolium]